MYSNFRRVSLCFVCASKQHKCTTGTYNLIVFVVDIRLCAFIAGPMSTLRTIPLGAIVISIISIKFALEFSHVPILFSVSEFFEDALEESSLTVFVKRHFADYTDSNVIL